MLSTVMLLLRGSLFFTLHLAGDSSPYLPKRIFPSVSVISIHASSRLKSNTREKRYVFPLKENAAGLKALR